MRQSHRHRRDPWDVIYWAIVAVILGSLVTSAMCAAGCVSARGRKMATEPPQRRQATIATPVGQSGVGQAGAANIALGASYSKIVNEAMPVGLTGLLGWIVWLSHRRETIRLGRQRVREPEREDSND